LEFFLNFSSALFTFIGGALSFYFYGVYSKSLSRKQKIIPKFFQLSSNECTSVVDSRYGSLGGAPNVYIGFIYLFFHSAVLIAAGFSFINQFIPFLLSLFSLVIGIYLIYGLIKLKIKCRICISVHLINLTVLFLQIPLIIK